jgi:hypothetical protein
MHSLLFTAGLLAVTARASYDSKPFDNFVTFGDSYTVSNFLETIVTSLEDDWFTWATLLLVSPRLW